MVICVKIICFVTYFAPFLGLGSLLAHWKAEQTPHKEYTDLPQFPYKPSDLFRTKFDKHGVSTLPSYTLYTFLTLGQAFGVFIGLLVLQSVMIAAVKSRFSEKFRTADWASKIHNIIANLTIPDAFRDFDEVDEDEEEKTPEEYRKNWTAVCKEVFALLVLNFLSNMMFLVPIWVTGKLLYIKQ